MKYHKLGYPVFGMTSHFCNWEWLLVAGSNQDAAFFRGIELLGRRMDIKVIYASMKRVKRGHYEVCSLDIESLPNTAAPHEIIEKFIQLVEKDIFDDSSSYLWSHNRCKHRKPTK